MDRSDSVLGGPREPIFEEGDVTLPVSACVDCATTIIGDRLRCPACHDLHARSFVFEGGDGENDTMAPPSTLKILLTWLVVAEMIAAIVAGCVLAVRGCG
jgi:hypothetical protein